MRLCTPSSFFMESASKRKRGSRSGPCRGWRNPAIMPWRRISPRIFMQRHCLQHVLVPLVVVPFLNGPPLVAVEIIAHRGASHDAPENTLAALKLGWQQGADAGELDVHLTKDGQIVVIHDADTKRTTGVNRAVGHSTLEEIRGLDAGNWKGSQWKDEKLPTLAEALETLPDGKRMFIEIKCGPEVLPALERVLKASGKKPEQLVLIGFDYATMEKARIEFPRWPVYWLVRYEADKRTGRHPEIEMLIEKAGAARFDGLDLDFKFPITPEFVLKVKEAGLRLYVWTVDDPAVAARLAAAGVDGITTDRPGWLRERLKCTFARDVRSDRPSSSMPVAVLSGRPPGR